MYSRSSIVCFPRYLFRLSIAFILLFNCSLSCIRMFYRLPLVSFLIAFVSLDIGFAFHTVDSLNQIALAWVHSCFNYFLLFYTFLFPRNIIFFNLIFSPCLHNRNFYVSFCSGSSIFIYSSKILSPSPFIIFPALYKTSAHFLIP